MPASEAIVSKHARETSHRRVLLGPTSMRARSIRSQQAQQWLARGGVIQDILESISTIRPESCVLFQIFKNVICCFSLVNLIFNR